MKILRTWNQAESMSVRPWKVPHICCKCSWTGWQGCSC